MTDEEIQQAATYFNAMPWTQWIRVVEVSAVPKTRIQGSPSYLVRQMYDMQTGAR